MRNVELISVLVFVLVAVGLFGGCWCDVASGSGRLEGVAACVGEEEGLGELGLLCGEPNAFPFRIEGSRFVRKSDSRPVFLNIIGYQPLEPEQPISGDIRERRVRDDLRRWRAYQSGSDPVVIRVYPGPRPEEPNRMPQIFYDGVRELGFWIIRDIYVSGYYWVPTAILDAYDQIDRVIAEVNDANAFDIIFAWEIGNEFGVHNGDVVGLEEFICQMVQHVKEEVGRVGGPSDSNLVTWAAGPFHDPLWTWDELPVRPDCLDYIGYNIYGYEPERMRDHQAGPVTGTPYQGYLAALKERYADKPLVISETGLSDSNSPEDTGDHARLHPWYPVYRKGGLTSEQVAEGLADRYWDARLLRDDNDPNMVIAGLVMFEWNDEWHKGESPPGEDNGLPEEHFGLGRFEKRANQEGYQLRYELQQETVRDLYTLNFDEDNSIIKGVTTDSNSLSVGEVTTVRAELSDEVAHPVRFRWESSRGYILGDSNGVEFYAGNVALGPATITAVAIDGNGVGNMASTSIEIVPAEQGEPNIAIFTLGTEKASGRVADANLQEYKLVVYIETNKMWVQPDAFMTSIWIRPDGYWWTKVVNNYDGDMICWLVPRSYVATHLPLGSQPPEGTIATATLSTANDEDNDLLPDWWEIQYFGAIEPNDRYDDPDGDGAHNLEEFLAGTSPNDANDNDVDGDGLWDNWERHFFGDVNFYDDGNDPDGDGLTNSEELALGLNPLRPAIDKDRDGLADLWEMRWFNDLSQEVRDNPDFDGCTNLDEYEVGLNPVFPDLRGDFDCDCMVDGQDFALFAIQWLSPRLPANIAPETPDRVVNFLDLKVFANAWLSTSTPLSPEWNPECDIFPDDKIDSYDFAVFAEQWLRYYYADIAPDEGDGLVNLLDLAVLADNWLRQL